MEAKRVLAGGLLAGAFCIGMIYVQLEDGESGHYADSSREVPANRTDRPLPAQDATADYAHEPAVAGRVESAVPVTSVAPVPATTVPDYEAKIRPQDMPPALLEMFQSAFTEAMVGNFDQAALVALDALEISDAYPVVKPMLHGVIGFSYEQLGYIDMAMEQYRAALSLHPAQRTSYDGMRRLDPDFAARHPELVAKPATDIEATKTDSQQNPAQN